MRSGPGVTAGSSRNVLRGSQVARFRCYHTILTGQPVVEERLKPELFEGLEQIPTESSSCEGFRDWRSSTLRVEP
jgi:hypothetical protein